MIDGCLKLTLTELAIENKEALASNSQKSIDKHFKDELLQKMRECIHMKFKELKNTLASNISRILQEENYIDGLEDKYKSENVLYIR